MTNEDVLRAIESAQGGADSEQLLAWLRRPDAREILTEGAGPIVHGNRVAWAVELADTTETPHITSVDGAFRLALERLPGTAVYVGVTDVSYGDTFRWRLGRGDEILRRGDLEVFRKPTELLARTDVPKGELIDKGEWLSRVFPGTTRQWLISVPAQYRDDQPARLFVFNDGTDYARFMPTLLDNMIADGELPPIVGVYIDPGDFPVGVSNRSFEYDTLSDQFARFLLDEMLPEVRKTVNITEDPEGRAIGGFSSGGICAWTVAWERPDQFRKVLSWCGSFANIAAGPSGIAGGHNYPFLIRRAAPKPIRVFLQGGENDIDNDWGNWALANKTMAQTLAYKGYDHRFEFGPGFHSHAHGKSLLPESLRWLWRE